MQAQQAASTIPANGLTNTLATNSPAAITYKDGRLSVIAENASLNQILSTISRLTGMKVTGTVAEEHVFGNYGPDTPAKVLAALLDGTSSNVLITQSPNYQNRTPGGPAPIELVLTPRGGPPSPPNPHPQPFDNAPHSEPATPYPIALPPPPPPVTTPAGISGASTGASGTDPNAAGMTGGAGASSSGTTLQQSPNDVKTPQQIYEQLQQLRQMQQQQQQSGRQP
jgi:hypothetical protein